jgi:gas vesicle protein
MGRFSIFLLGVIAGSAISVLYAPRKGSETRNILSKPRRIIDEVQDYIKENHPRTGSRYASSGNERNR